MAQNLTTDQLIYSRIVALTGGIGTGKSAATRFLEEKGAVTVSADQLAHEITAPGGSALPAIVARFGPRILNPDGSLNRRLIAEIVFTDPAARADLEAITHPLIRQAALKAFVNCLKSNPRLVIYDCPLYFESKLDRLGFKAVIVVSAPPEVVRSRLMSGRKMTQMQIDQRIAAQIPLAEKVARADFILDNSGTLEKLKDQCGRLFDQLCT